MSEEKAYFAALGYNLPLELIAEPLRAQRSLRALLSSNLVSYVMAAVHPTIQEDWTLQQNAEVSLARGWPALRDSVTEELEAIDAAVEPGSYYPEAPNVFRAFINCPLADAKVVWVGQDPYPDGQATGLSFGVRRKDRLPSSLQNMYKELQSCYPGTRLRHGDLTPWSRRGILLINSTLTIKPGEKLSHEGHWDGFLTQTIAALNDRRGPDGRALPCVFVLLGKKAEKLKRLIASGHRIVTAAHPSGLSANRGFFGSELYKKIDAELGKIGHPPMNWNIE